MENNVTIKATIEEMNKFFDSEDVCSVRYFESNNNRTFKTRIRHAELLAPLRGVFTIKGFMKRLNKEINGLIIKVPYVFVWDGGTEIHTTAAVNIKTGEVTDIVSADSDGGLEVCESEYIVMNDERVYVYHDEHGYAHWADIKNEYCCT